MFNKKNNVVGFLILIDNLKKAMNYIPTDIST